MDLVREVKPPFSPDVVVEEFASVLKGYGCFEVVGDRYSGAWVRERFSEHGVNYRLADKTKSELYLEVLPAIKSAKVELLDHSRLLAQLVGLERRTSRRGKDSIDHAPSSHDDIANACAGTVTMALEEGVPYVPVVTALVDREEHFFDPPRSGRSFWNRR